MFMSIAPLVDASTDVPFGTLLGVTDGGVHVYCCDYETLNPNEILDREKFKNVHDGVTTGYKWQCVELGRRYLLVNQGVIFDNIAMAYDIFRLKHVRRVADGQMVPMYAHVNGEADVLPTKGSLLIWNPVGEFVHTGHIAVIVNVECDFVDIVEQNVEDMIWPEGQSYSRRLKATLNDDTGAYTIACTYHDSSILGWMNIDFHTEYNYEDVPIATPEDLKLQTTIITPDMAARPWMDATLDFVQAFQRQFGPHLEPGVSKYFTISEKGAAALVYATEHLHHMFMDATDYVLHHEKELMSHFRIPKKLWPRIRRSWFRR
jgi:glutathionylspermidine amidase/synthetase